MLTDIIRDLILFKPDSLVVFPLLCIAISLIATALIQRYNFMKEVEKISGPPAQIPFYGSLTDMFFHPDEFMMGVSKLIQHWKKDGPIVRVWIGSYPLFIITTPEATEVFLSSSKNIEKSQDYTYLHAWLGTGLLTSSGSKWFHRRKILTPAFHFKILEDFLFVFNKQSRVMIKKLNEACEGSPSDIVICPFVTRCTLDVICETAMGRHIDAQNKEESDYVHAIYKMGEIVQLRQLRPWLQPNWLFRLSSHSSEEKRCLDILHGFTDKVITAKRQEYEQRPKESKNTEEDALGKRRLAFLDLLLEYSKENETLTDKDIREEVDTFMFEGHDTTAAAISWALYLIGSHPDAQALCNEELNRVFGDSDRNATTADLTELKYLECCLKESLRLYPSVPVMARRLTEDVKMHGHKIPAGNTVLLFNFLLHRDADSFPDPDRFIPERFFPENAKGRHPYAYVPFSAGPRNCIGQKFAMMEQKVLVSTVLRNFHVESLDKESDLWYVWKLVLRTRDGIRLRLKPKMS